MSARRLPERPRSVQASVIGAGSGGAIPKAEPDDDSTEAHREPLHNQSDRYVVQFHLAYFAVVSAAAPAAIGGGAPRSAAVYTYGTSVFDALRTPALTLD